MRMNKLLQSGLAIVLAICLLLPGGFISQAALAEDTTMDGTVRVYLSSLGSPSRLDITICGSYSLDGSGATALANGSTVTVGFNSATGQLTLTQNGVTTAMGTDFRLRRHTTSAADNGVKISQARVSGNLYPGDLQFKSVRSGGVYKLYTIAHVFIEDYLYGVLPYEMGNSSPLESLKAQCVSARTYTVRAMNASTARSYDVVDTTSDQVYNGTPSGNARCVQAVQETRGLVSMNGNAYTATYYTASNGGQIESVSNIWGSIQYDYITVKDDPYDYQNPASVVRSFQVNKSGAQSNSTLGSLLNAKAQAVFGTQSVSIESIDAVTPHTPRYAAPSRTYTKLRLNVTFSANGATRVKDVNLDTYGDLETFFGLSINSGSNEIIGLTEMSYLDELSTSLRNTHLEKLFSFQPPAVVLTRGMRPMSEMMQYAKQYGVPLLMSTEMTSALMGQLITTLNTELAPRITRHGVLVEVYGEGILILGDSGVGKSETAIELVKRGHRLIADDAVELRRVSYRKILGTAPANIRHFIELRGIGIINVARVFGIGSVRSSVEVEMVVQLEPWDRTKNYDRTGLETEYYDILGVKVPSMLIPVMPGRNLAVILETAAINNRQKEMGYNAAKELLTQLGLADDISK